uniref:Mitochondrial inner membrane protease subunit 2 n=1 Tax=Strigamia maritima TaxID=126957 RepID=T1JHL3_STRMM
MVGYVAKVEGISMQPSLNPDFKSTDYVLLNRWSIRNFDVARGDVVSLFSPKDPDQKIIKRIIGLEGDTVKTLGYKDKFVRIPEGHCWVEGDHHGHSMDSNSFGPVAIGMVNAKASYIVWPPQRWQRLHRHLPETRRPINLTDAHFDLLFPDFFFPSL